MHDSENLKQIIRFEVDPTPFGEDTEENPFFDVDKYKSHIALYRIEELEDRRS